MSQPDGGRVIVCHGYGCTRRQAVNIDGTVIQRAATLLKSARSAEAERERLVRSCGSTRPNSRGNWAERPTGQDRLFKWRANTARWIASTKQPTPRACSLNSTARGLLAHHHAARPESRGFFFDGRYPHFTAVIVGRQSRQRMGGRSLEARARAKAGYPAARRNGGRIPERLITS